MIVRKRWIRLSGTRWALGWVVFLALARSAAAEAPSPSLSVTGTGRVHAAPDTAHLEAGVTTDAPQAEAAVRANSQVMKRILESLREREIAPKEIQTRQLQLAPRYAQGPNGRRGRISGYRATSRIHVRVAEISRAGAILDALVAAGANDLGSISFAVRDPAPLLDRARVAAVADAKRKAALLAREAGLRLGPLLELRDGETPRAFPAQRGARLEGGFAAQSVPIAAGELEFTARVSLVYELRAAN